MPKLVATTLDLPRCPHCNVDRPSLVYCGQAETKTFEQGNLRRWRFYSCVRCGGVVTASAANWDQDVRQLFPSSTGVDTAIPDRARSYLDQAINSLSAPAGAVMLAASAVDAMLKARNLKDGSLYSRIAKAADDHLITRDMALWAHEVRLEANEQRHSDESVPLPTPADAQRAVEFTIALAQFMFVLPARVQLGIDEAKKTA